MANTWLSLCLRSQESERTNQDLTTECIESVLYERKRRCSLYVPQLVSPTRFKPQASACTYMTLPHTSKAVWKAARSSFPLATAPYL